jgi:hypothetical protein
MATVVFAVAGIGGLAILWIPDQPIWLDKAAVACGFGILLLLLALVDDRLSGGLVGWMGRLVRWVDTRLRFFDFWAHRTVGGPMGDTVHRHTFAAILLPAVLVFFIVNGPALRPTWRLALAALGAIVSVLLFLAALHSGLRRRHSFQYDVVVQCLLIAAIAGAVWVMAPAHLRERDETLLYRHVLLTVTALLAGAVLLGSALATHLFGSERGRMSVPKRLRLDFTR